MGYRSLGGEPRTRITRDADERVSRNASPRLVLEVLMLDLPRA